MSSTTTSITTPFRCAQMKPFPTGFCILVLDSDRTSIEMTESLLASYQYKVIVAERATEALLMVGESRHKIDIVLTEFDLPDMDGLKFVEKVLEIRSLPVIFLSKFANDGEKFQCLLEGAEFCYDKPLQEYTAKNLWQFCVCKSDSSSISEISDSIWVMHVSRNANMHIVDDVILENSEEVVADSYPMPARKRKMSWTPELHEKFVVAVDTIGFFAARPKSILKLMNTPELTSKNVASHLQRYRAQMKGKATQTMPLGMAESESHLKMNSELHADAPKLFPLPSPEGSITKSPRQMSPGPYKGIGCGIYNELAQQLKEQGEINHHYDLPDLNVGLNAAGTSGGENGNGSRGWDEKTFVARGRMPPVNFMNAYRKDMV